MECKAYYGGFSLDEIRPRTWASKDFKANAASQVSPLFYHRESAGLCFGDSVHVEAEHEEV